MRRVCGLNVWLCFHGSLPCQPLVQLDFRQPPESACTLEGSVVRLRAGTPPNFASVSVAVCHFELAPAFRGLLLQNKGTGYLIWVGWTMFFTMAAASVGHLISPFADGSGLPQIKSILGGSPLRNFFGWPVMVAKAIGCFFGLAAGLTMGKEVRCVVSRRVTRVKHGEHALDRNVCVQGPFAHIAAIACHKLWRLPVFNIIRTNVSLRRQVIAAGACFCRGP